MPSSLDAFLQSNVERDRALDPVAATVRALCGAAVAVADTIRVGGSNGGLGAAQGETNAAGDAQKALDVLADKVFLDAAKAAPVAVFGSEEQEGAVVLDEAASLALAIDPLDGSSNIETNVSIGTIFSILPMAEEHRGAPEQVFRQPGSAQRGAGFFIYGPQLLLVLTLGNGTAVFIHTPEAGGFVALGAGLSIPAATSEFAVNASNYRHWDARLRGYVDDCLAGADGPLERDFNMRWIGSMVADGYRILSRGGVFLYPGDARKGYADGRLRLLYEANPVAMCVEQAGGAATDGVRRVLDIEPDELHQRVPLVFGSREEVERVARYMAEPASASGRAT